MHDGSWCLAAALTAVWDEEFGEEVLMRSENILAHQIQYVAPASKYRKPIDITTYNDCGDTRFEDILQVIDLGLYSLTNCETHVCNCAYKTVTVVVEWAKPVC